MVSGRGATAGAGVPGRGATAGLGVLLALLVAALGLAGCGGGSTVPAAAGTGAAAALAPPPPISWHPCPSPSGYRCGTVQVPVDYAHPGRGSIGLAVAERPAPGGAAGAPVLLFNPGGPGESGVQILPVLAAQVPPLVAQTFTLVSFDERGTGASHRLACGPPPAQAASLDPLAPPGGRLAAASFSSRLWASCDRRYPSLLPTVNTRQAARDMDRIRQALGVPTLSYWGLSYGTVLGAAYAHLFPGRVRAMVLDGAVDPTTSLADQARQEAPAIQASLNHFFTSCAADPACPLRPNPRAAFDRVAAALAAHPLPAPGGGDPVPVTLGDLDAATLFALSVPGVAGNFPAAVAAAGAGNGAPLRALSLGFEEDLDGTSLVAPQWAYTCNDSAGRPTPAAAASMAGTLAARYGPVAAYAVTYILGGCLNWPVPPTPVPPVSRHGGPPIVVVGNTGDPNTPHAAAVSLARTMAPARLVTWEGWGHTWLLNGSSDPCMQQVLSAYLVHVQAPAAGTTCR